MTEEELRDIIEGLTIGYCNGEYFPELTERIFAAYREAGYEPPESVREMVEKSYEDGVDDTEQKYKGYMSTEMVKGLVFELQAKKCAACPKNKEGK